MPVSDPNNLPLAISAALHLRPESILDVGMGIGAYGVLFRQYFDIARGRLNKDEWILRLDGVEVFGDYQNPIWGYFYDTIWQDDIRHIAGLLPDYDLVVLCDVLEHFEKPDAYHLLGLLLDKSKCVLITTPSFEYPQGVVFGNRYETHHSQWRVSDFREWPSWHQEQNGTLFVVLARSRLHLAFLFAAALPITRIHKVHQIFPAKRVTRRFLKRIVQMLWRSQ